ncbi:hypothetical protein JHK82_052702 [Glycine max]|nr:hypothetical protein JHK86_052550 [Glycine max]KAG4926911.1 hypothetical protein JHK85_053397 [Glycine max]KAG5082550.1 hypothetical protein JHK84_052588 [Glycine max]KAG5085305.1 hypothetical protein JHK82_052702 [Glycine max]
MENPLEGHFQKGQKAHGVVCTLHKILAIQSLTHRPIPLSQRPKCNFASKESSSKEFVVDDALEEESDNDDSDEKDDKLSLITRKIRKIWKSKNSSRFNSLFKRPERYECKKPECFKSKCPDHEKSKDKKKFFKSKKKSLMSTREDLDDSSFDEGNEDEANLCLMAYASTSKAKPTLDASSDNEDPQLDDLVNSNGEEVIFKSREDLIKGYNQLLFASTHVSKAYRKLSKHFQHLERKHEDLKKIHQAHLVDFVLETTLPGDVQLYKTPLFVRRSRHYRMKRYPMDGRFFLRIFKTWKKG